jgi:hypothetical protein
MNEMEAGKHNEIQQQALVLAVKSVAETLGVDTYYNPSNISDTIGDTWHESMRNQLEEYIVELLTKSPEQMMRILYRIDVDERLVKEIINTAPIGSIASKLSELILDRMKQKVLTRLAYKTELENKYDKH